MSKTTNRPIFVLGAGAQKCGTSWLYRTLQKQPWSDFGVMKEYHVWDSKFCDLITQYSPPPTKDENPNISLRRAMQSDNNYYAQYFRDLIRGDVTLTGDITPSYSLLSGDQFKEVKSCVERVGLEPKIIFLMRDPVERIWSALQMGPGNQKKRTLRRQ